MPAPAIAISLDATYIRSCHEGERHLKVRVDNAETPEGGRQVFGAAAKGGTGVAALIRRVLDTLGSTKSTALTAFTDGCPGLRTVLAAAGVAEVRRLRWRVWNGKAKNARITLKRIRTLLPAFEERPARKLRRALRAVDRHLRSQSAWLVNHAERHRAGLRIGMSVTEGTANFLVNRRMAKSQQMRWSRRGADLLLQVRCALRNGALGSGFGQLSEPVPNAGRQSAEAT